MRIMFNLTILLIITLSAFTVVYLKHKNRTMNISIENKFLFSSFEDQLNDLHFFMDSEKKTIMTHKEKTFDSISF